VGVFPARAAAIVERGCAGSMSATLLQLGDDAPGSPAEPAPFGKTAKSAGGRGRLIAGCDGIVVNASYCAWTRRQRPEEITRRPQDRFWSALPTVRRVERG
jgi:hypothetical protein